jgi:transposase
MSTRKVTASPNGAVENVSARRAGRPAGGTTPTAAPDPEVVAKPTRRRFTAEYKLRILQEGVLPSSRRILGVP